MLLYYKMKIFTEKNVKANLKAYGFESADFEVIDMLNKSFDMFLNKTIEKARRYSKDGKIEERHMLKALGFKNSQKGGAETTMPLEYFGVDSGNYHDNVNMGIDMQVTDNYIRPALNMNDPSNIFEDIKTNGMTGGNIHKISVSKCAFQKACGQCGGSIPTKVREHIQRKYENEISDVINKVKKLKTNSLHLSTETLDKVLSQSKYSKLFKE